MVLFNLSLLLKSEFLFDLTLVAISCIQEFASFFCRNVCEFLRSLLLISKPLDAVLQRLVLHHLVLQHLLLLHHLVAHHQAVLYHLGMAAIVERCVTVSGRHSD